MLYTLLILITLATTQSTCAKELTIHLHSSPVTMNADLTMSNGILLDNQTNVQQQSHLTNSSTTIQNIFNQARDQAQEYTYGIFSWIAQNKTKSAAYTAALGYGYVWYKLLSLNYALLQRASWSHWHNTLTLEELLAQPQQEVATDLLTAIQRQYTIPEQFDDLIGPLILFVRDVDTEIAQLRQLVHLHTWIDRLRMSFLFPKQSALLESSQDKINRLTYLKNLLLNWVSQHKVTRLASAHASS